MRIINGSTIPRQLLLVPYPQFSQLSLQNLPIGRQSYHGLQTKLTKRFSQGFTFVASYAFSKTLEQLTLLNPQDLVLNNIDATPLEKRSATETDVPISSRSRAYSKYRSGKESVLVPLFQKRPITRSADGNSTGIWLFRADGQSIIRTPGKCRAATPTLRTNSALKAI